MNSTTIDPTREIIEGEKICGYQVMKIFKLPEIRSEYYLLTHLATGARHIHIKNNDKENAFAVGFRTVPRDSTGVAHVLEHTVLCGSKRFPVRDPFFSMVKRSMNTFMNAFTASDWTMYPFCSQNKKDFYNLMDVYLDAAFFPKIDELSFKQEGCRIEPLNNSSKSSTELAFKGVVYNEMKGAMSSPSQIMVRSILNALFPETTYRFNSGGDPKSIPDLTYEGLKEFHKNHYNPGNAFFYTYGDLPLEEHLTFILEKVLIKFQPLETNTSVEAQPRWDKPKAKTYNYPLAKSEDPSQKSQAAVAWLMADIKDSFEVLVLSLLEQILLGNSGSPLRKALIDSRLGTALCDGTGFDPDSRDTLFICGLKDVSPSSAKKIEEIIFRKLEELSDKGIDPMMIESAIHQMEFHKKEITNTPYPFGLKLLLSFFGSWIHGADPESVLKIDSHLNKIQNELLQGKFFENKINQYFLENTHRVLITLEPDQSMTENSEKEISEKLAKKAKSLSAEQIEELARDALRLKERQETSEDLSCLPKLDIKDIPPEIQTANESIDFNHPKIKFYDQPTSGIFYFSLAAGIGGLPHRLLPLVPLFCTAFTRSGTEVHDYSELAKLMDLYTGGMGMSASAMTSFAGKGDCMPIVSFAGKCLARNQDNMFKLMDELFQKMDFSNLSRLKSLLLEYRAGMESMIVSNGHRLSISLASRCFTKALALREKWHGIHQLKTIRELSRDDNKILENLSSDLMEIGKLLFKRENIVPVLVGETKALEKGEKAAASFLDSFPLEGKSGFPSPELSVPADIPYEGWSTSTSVSFVARTFTSVPMAHEDSPALSIISKIMKSMYLHREIREKGGAYGGFSLYNLENGLFSMASYRDPHILSTLKAFDGAETFIKSGKYNDDDIKEAIIQVCSDIDKPDTPAAKAKKAFFRKLTGLTDKARLQYKKDLLSIKKDKIMATAEKYFTGENGKKAVAVISGEEKLAETNKKMTSGPFSIHKI